MSELTERLRKMASIETSALYSQRKYLNEAADALEAQEAKINIMLSLLEECQRTRFLSDGSSFKNMGEIDEFLSSHSKALTPSLPK